MAIDIYMKIEDPIIAGDSAAKGHTQEFEILALSFGAVGAAANSPSLSPITVTTYNYNGPRLLSALDLAETHRVTFRVYRSSSNGEALFETIVLEEAKITRFQSSINGGDDRPVLELAFSYRRIDYRQNGLPFVYTRPR